MKRVDRLFFLVLRRTLQAFSLLIFLIGLYTLAAMLFNFPTTIRTDKNTTYDFNDFNNAIPVKAHVSSPVPDSSVMVDGKYGRRRFEYFPGSFLHLANQGQVDEATYSDTIRIRFARFEDSPQATDHWNIRSASLGTMTFYVTPTNFKQKLLLTLPTQLYYFLVAFILWQLAMLLNAITRKEFFDQRNYQRIASVGWSIIIYNVIAFVVFLFKGINRSIRMEVESTIPNYRAPFDLTGIPTAEWSLWWVVGGMMILAFARAFKKGHNLERDQIYTV